MPIEPGEHGLTALALSACAQRLKLKHSTKTWQETTFKPLQFVFQLVRPYVMVGSSEGGSAVAVVKVGGKGKVGARE